MPLGQVLPNGNYAIYYALHTAAIIFSKVAAAAILGALCGIIALMAIKLLIGDRLTAGLQNSVGRAVCCMGVLGFLYAGFIYLDASGHGGNQAFAIFWMIACAALLVITFLLILAGGLRKPLSR